MWRVLLPLALLPVIELYVLVQLGHRIGALPTIGLVVATGLLGTVLARTEGLRVLREFQRSLAQGMPPAEGVVRGLLVLLGGALLIVPGLISDALGLLLLVPFTRNLAARLVLARIRSSIERGTLRVAHVTAVGVPPGAPPPQPGRGQIIDVEGETVSSSPPPEPPPRLPPGYER